MKNTFVISAPVDTYSGYGARSRDFVKALIESDKYEVKILSQRWGNTQRNFIKDNNVKEFTVECGRPDTLTKNKLQTMKDCNVDRISINPQTMNDKTLKLIKPLSILILEPLETLLISPL